MGIHIVRPIPFGSIVSFAARYGIDDLCEFDCFADVMRRIDGHELVHINKPTKP